MLALSYTLALQERTLLISFSLILNCDLIRLFKKWSKPKKTTLWKFKYQHSCPIYKLFSTSVRLSVLRPCNWKQQYKTVIFWEYNKWIRHAGLNWDSPWSFYGKTPRSKQIRPSWKRGENAQKKLEENSFNMNKYMYIILLLSMVNHWKNSNHW